MGDEWENDDVQSPISQSGSGPTAVVRMYSLLADIYIIAFIS